MSVNGTKRIVGGVEVNRDVQIGGKAYISMLKSTSRCTDKTFSVHLDAQIFPIMKRGIAGRGRQ